MKVLLTAVNAKYIHSNLAIRSIRQYAVEHTRGFEREQAERIEIAEFTINQRRDEIVREIYRRKPDLVAFSCYIWNIEMIEACAQILKIMLPHCRIWMGGPEASFETEKLLRDHPYIDGAMQGEGEAVFLKLLKYCLRAEEPVDGHGASAGLSDIPSIVYRGPGGEIFRGRPVTLSDLPPMDELPFVYTDPEPFRNKIIYYESSRGCPFSCGYCLSSAGEGVRFRSLGRVLPELQFFLDAKVPQVKFVDRTFNCSHDRTLAIWRYLKEHDNGITNFHFEIEANVLTDDEVDLACSLRPGLIQMEIGVQTANRRALEAVRRNPDLSRIIRCSGRILEKRNIHLHLDLIAALPYEDYASFRHSFNTVYALKPDELQLGFLKLLKGTALRRDAEKYGIRYSPLAPYEALCTSWLDCDELLKLKDIEEMLEIFYNSRQFTVTVEALEKCFPDAFSLFEALARWHRTRGLMKIARSRMERCDDLRQFILSEICGEGSDGGAGGRRFSDREKMNQEPSGGEKRPQKSSGTDRTLWEERLLCDLYLRENLKKRPGWAPEPQHEKVRLFYREHREYQGHTHLEYFRKLEGQPAWILFDYSRRSVLTGNADRIQVEIGGRQGKAPGQRDDPRDFRGRKTADDSQICDLRDLSGKN